MKPVRYGAAGQEKPGMIDGSGRLRDLSGMLDDITPEQLSDAALGRLGSLDASSLPEVTEPCRFAPPVAGIRKFTAIGLNYSDHAQEANMPIPTEPAVFSKATSCIAGANDDVMLPFGSTKLDWEVELGVVIGGQARHVREEDALASVAGYCVVNGVSERAFQFERGPTWDKGKGCGTFGPIGPWLVIKNEVPDPQSLSLLLDVNGVRMQDGNTRTMIFLIARIVSFVSRFITLQPGDVVTTGTPPGVGLGIKPVPRFLHEGDVMRLGIEGLGIQQQRVVAFKP